MTQPFPAAATPDIPLHERPEIHQRRWFLLGILCMSLVMVVMAVSGLNVALPSMQRSLGASATDLQWIMSLMAQDNAWPFTYTGGSTVGINWTGPAQMKFGGYWQ